MHKNSKNGKLEHKEIFPNEQKMLVLLKHCLIKKPNI